MFLGSQADRLPGGVSAERVAGRRSRRLDLDLTADLKARQVPIQIDPVQTACGALYARRRAATGNASFSSMRDRPEPVGVDRMVVLKQEEIRRYEEHLGSEIRRYDHRASASTSSETMTVAQSVSVAVTVGTELAETDMGGLQIGKSGIAHHSGTDSGAP